MFRLLDEKLGLRLSGIAGLIRGLGCTGDGLGDHLGRPEPGTTLTYRVSVLWLGL
jgi:hypothetical protein